MITTSQSGTVAIHSKFIAGDIVHPKALPGHIKYALCVIEPSELGLHPVVGHLYVRRYVPQLSLPENFYLLTITQQNAYLDLVDSIALVDATSVVLCEDKGLCFVSREWIALNMQLTTETFQGHIGNLTLDDGREPDSRPITDIRTDGDDANQIILP